MKTPAHVKRLRQTAETFARTLEAHVADGETGTTRSFTLEKCRYTLLPYDMDKEKLAATRWNGSFKDTARNARQHVTRMEAAARQPTVPLGTPELPLIVIQAGHDGYAPNPRDVAPWEYLYGDATTARDTIMRHLETQGDYMEEGQVAAAWKLLRNLQKTLDKKASQNEQTRRRNLFDALPENLKDLTWKFRQFQKHKPGRSKSAKEMHAKTLATYTETFETLIQQQPDPELARLHTTYIP